MFCVKVLLRELYILVFSWYFFLVPKFTFNFKLFALMNKWGLFLTCPHNYKWNVHKLKMKNIYIFAYVFFAICKCRNGERSTRFADYSCLKRTYVREKREAEKSGVNRTNLVWRHAVVRNRHCLLSGTTQCRFCNIFVECEKYICKDIDRYF